jgi:crotonobetainyl-CoA:carnitine CoA-transferase CaiB-like acyl-CoA transferase
MLSHLNVTEIGSGIAAAYCTRLLADAGARVTVLEPSDGHPLRRWASVAGGRQGLLFDFLVQGKQCIAGDDPLRSDAVARADIVVEDLPVETVTALEAGARSRGQVVVSLSPFGRTGRWRDRPSSEFTIQAMCGSTGRRGLPGSPPVYGGGELGLWAAGSYGAAAAACFARAVPRQGAHIDVSILEASALVLQSYWTIDLQLRGAAPRSVRAPMIPSIEPTADGYVGFSTITAEQFHTFLIMIEQPQLTEDLSLLRADVREQRRDELLGLIHQWTTTRTTAEIVELATSFRIPVAPIGTGVNLPSLDHFAARGVYSKGPDGLLQPRVPFHISPFAPPRHGPDDPGCLGSAQCEAARDQSDTVPAGTPADTGVGAATGAGAGAGADALPLRGLRVADFTTFWAGPSATHFLASLGADVIKVESIRRPDGMRFTSAKPEHELFYEWGTVFQAVNPNKRAITLDLSQPEGLALAGRLIAWSDVVVENFSPRVMEGFGLGAAQVAQYNPRAVMVRMPAFGLSGPWRDRPGFAMTVEQASGMAWRTGYLNGPPMDVGGICDPLGGMHAVVAIMAALAERDRSDQGALVEVPMVEVALTMTAELVLAYDLDGTVISHEGNRGPGAAPQGCYRGEGDDVWFALSITDDQQWRSLVDLLGSPAWASDPSLETAAGRHRLSDTVDVELSRAFAHQDAAKVVESLISAGIPAAQVVVPTDILRNPQLRDRQFFEVVTHPVIGSLEVPSLPFRATTATGLWNRTPAPTLGQHNEEVLGGLLGLSEEQLHSLRAAGVIGDRLVAPSA